jgi:hypothetical protein
MTVGERPRSEAEFFPASRQIVVEMGGNAVLSIMLLRSKPVHAKTPYHPLSPKVRTL